MPEILFCNRRTRPGLLKNQCGINAETISGLSCSSPGILHPYTPYLVGQHPSIFDRAVLGQLTPAPVARKLTNLTLSFGDDNTLALAGMTSRLQEFNLGLVGASTSVYANRIGGFAGAVKNYQAALMEYRQAIKSGAVTKTMAGQKVHVAFQRMQTGFRHELAAITSQSRARKGTPLSSVKRAMNIARSSRSVARLQVADRIQANNLVKFSRYAKFLGGGLVVIDFGSRVGSIHNSYQSDGDWERELFVESSSFVASAVTATSVVNVGSVALSFLMVATPVGWVGLVIGGIAVAGVAAGASIWANNKVKNNSGSLYDDIMMWINSP